jgi:hypothetical protein
MRLPAEVHPMTASLRVLAFIIFACLGGARVATAQSVGPDEAVGPNGSLAQKLQLTPAQRSAIYNAVMRERVRGSGRGINAAIGAMVPPSVTLRNLPGLTAVDAATASDLKYAMVEDDVVVVDPIGMRVVAIISPGARR